MKKWLIIFVVMLLTGCVPYHYVKTGSVEVNFADEQRINDEYLKTKDTKHTKVRAFITNKHPCVIWVQEGDTWALGHEMEHCLNEIEEWR